MFDLENRSWWNYVEEDLQELFIQAIYLWQKAIDLKEAKNEKYKFHDFSYTVFPAAKAYEGFLKKVFLDRGFITKEDYFGKHFRIGKALNPFLDSRYRIESVYDRIVEYCGGKKLADMLWETWKGCRNLVFHWFPKEKNVLTLDEAKMRLEQIFNTMDAATKECKINGNKANSGLRS